MTDLNFDSIVLPGTLPLDGASPADCSTPGSPLGELLERAEARCRALRRASWACAVEALVARVPEAAVFRLHGSGSVGSVEFDLVGSDGRRLDDSMSEQSPAILGEARRLAVVLNDDIRRKAWEGTELSERARASRGLRPLAVDIGSDAPSAAILRALGDLPGSALCEAALLDSEILCFNGSGASRGDSGRL